MAKDFLKKELKAMTQKKALEKITPITTPLSYSNWIIKTLLIYDDEIFSDDKKIWAWHDRIHKFGIKGVLKKFYPSGYASVYRGLSFGYFKKPTIVEAGEQKRHKKHLIVWEEEKEDYKEIKKVFIENTEKFINGILEREKLDKGNSYSINPLVSFLRFAGKRRYVESIGVVLEYKAPIEKFYEWGSDSESGFTNEAELKGFLDEKHLKNIYINTTIPQGNKRLRKMSKKEKDCFSLNQYYEPKTWFESGYLHYKSNFSQIHPSHQKRYKLTKASKEMKWYKL